MRTAAFLTTTLLFVALAGPSTAAAPDDAPTLEQLIEDLQGSDLQAQREAAYELARLGRRAKPAVPALIEALGEGGQASDRFRFSVSH